MREIKFRAWNGRKPEMLLLGDLTKANWDIRFIFKHYEIMQYTGLKDKNGVEIYEGDICTVDDDGEYFPQDIDEETQEWHPTSKAIIYWSDDSACFWIKPTDSAEFADLEINPFGYAVFEVIGNIYENSGLLK